MSNLGGAAVVGGGDTKSGVFSIRSRDNVRLLGILGALTVRARSACSTSMATVRSPSTIAATSPFPHLALELRASVGAGCRRWLD